MRLSRTTVRAARLEGSTDDAISHCGGTQVGLLARGNPCVEGRVKPHVGHTELHERHNNFNMSAESKNRVDQNFTELGQTKHPKPSGCFGGSPFKKRETLGNV